MQNHYLNMCYKVLFLKSITNLMLCTIWYHLYNLKNVKNTHGGVLLLVKLQAKSLSFTKSNTPPWVFFTFFELCKWYQIAQGCCLRSLFHSQCLTLFYCPQWQNEVNLWRDNRKCEHGHKDEMLSCHLISDIHKGKL